MVLQKKMQRKISLLFYLEQDPRASLLLIRLLTLKSQTNSLLLRSSVLLLLKTSSLST